MRALLSTLLSFAFLEAQALAVHQPHPGELGGGNVPNVVGTYAGVLLPGGSDSNSDSSSSSSSSGSNSIGVFSLSVPLSGIGSGAFVAFSGGRQFNGTVQAVADPDFGNLRGVLEATFDLTLQQVTTGTDNTLTTTSITITATLAGDLNATITPTTFGLSDNPSLARIDGTAHLDVNFGGVNSSDFSPIISNSIDFTVIGFKQSLTTTSDSGSGSSSQ